MKRTAKTLLSGIAVGAVAFVSSACVAPPLTYPLLLAGEEDATVEVQALLGSPPPVITSSSELVAEVARKLVKPEPGCELFPASRVIWRAPAAQTTAAIELRIPCDDAVAGRWYELTITGDDQVGFVVALATKQSICKRGVDGVLCV